MASSHRSRKRSIGSTGTAATAESSSTGSSYTKLSASKNRSPSSNTTKGKPKGGATKRIARALSLSLSTVNAVAVLFLAILTAMMWNIWDGAHTWNHKQSQTDQRIKQFLQRVCHDDEDVYCHPSLVPKRRTQMALREIPAGERVLQVPRDMQIWDLDALRSDWVRQNLWGAKHAQTRNPLDSAAYLAMYLALLTREIVVPPPTTTGPSESSSCRVLEYLKECMPSREDLADFHPLFWDEEELRTMIRPHSATFAVVKAYRDMVRSEYQALAQAYQTSTTGHLQDVISEDEYRTFRIIVLSRSFGTGPIPVHPSSSSETSLSEEELGTYMREGGIDLSKGCYSMVPILDFYDHHATPNVQYAYNNDNHAFVIQATGQGIAAGQEVVDTYGKFTDAHLFAKFGFVNGDGSGYSQANLAIWHRVMDMDLKKQFSYLPMKGGPSLPAGLQKALDKQHEDVARYLKFDDGYDECIKQGSDHPEEAFELKRLKLEHLARIANHARRWNIVALPRAPDSLPARASNIPITTSPPKVNKQNSPFFHRKEYKLVSATCRLISLTHEDYNGEAVDILRKNLQNNSFLLESQLNEESSPDSLEAALEFRTHFCLARLATEALQRYDVTISEEEDNVAKLNRQSFQSKEWTAAHLRLSEMQALDSLRHVSFSAAREYEAHRNQSPPFTIRDAPCPED